MSLFRDTQVRSETLTTNGFVHDFGRIPVHAPAPLKIQPKLVVNTPGDIYEQQADEVSEQVLRMPKPELRQTEEPGDGHDRLLTKRVGSGDSAQTEMPPIIREVLRSPGQPIDQATRSFMEPRFGRDFTHVRLHTDESAMRSASTINAHAYTVGNDIVFGRGRFDSNTREGRRLLAHELTHVVQQSTGYAPRAVARQPADVEADKSKTPTKSPKCKTGCSMRWGRDTTCSKWGLVESVHEGGEGKKWRSFPCCNSWPLSLETYARNQGLSGAASCPVQHQKEIATISFGEKEVEVLCSDTIPNDMVGETASARACSGKIEKEVIEMSPKAMQDLSGQVAKPLHVRVCFSGSKEDLCLHNGPGAGRFPTITQCLTRGCSPAEGPLDHEKSGWLRV